MVGRVGLFALICARDGLPQSTAIGRAPERPRENRAVVQLSIAISGAESAEDAGKTLVRRVESSAFPNRVGSGQRHALTLSGDGLTCTTPGSGAAVTLRRAT